MLVIVGLLLIGALLVDRFVLLPEFDGGDGSAGVALATWLGVNLLPALAWLALNARRAERTRGQLLAGTLAVLTTTAILIVPVLIWWTAEDDAVGASAGDAPQISSPQASERLEGEFEIAGEPVAHGWEQELEDARKKFGG